MRGSFLASERTVADELRRTKPDLADMIDYEEQGGIIRWFIPGTETTLVVGLSSRGWIWEHRDDDERAIRSGYLEAGRLSAIETVAEAIIALAASQELHA